MAIFSQRMGIVQASKIIQLERMDADLRNRIWNVICVAVWKALNVVPPRYSDSLRVLINAIWHELYKEPIDEIPPHFDGPGQSLEIVRDRFFKAAWYEVYDFVEFLVQNLGPYESRALTNGVNAVCLAENSAYQIVGKEVTPITDAEQIESIDGALNSPLSSVRDHIKQALVLFSDRKNPDYRNSVKESISAVEAVCKAIAGDDSASLGEALKKLTGMHPAFEQGLHKLYGYTSDAGGIWHSLIEGSRQPSAAEARFVLVLASAYVGYALEVAAQLETQ